MALFENAHIWHLAVAFVFCYVFYKWIVHPLFFSPLSTITQAHSSTAPSPAWILWQRYNRQPNEAVDLAHKKHDPIARTGPNKVSVSCVKRGMHTMYNGGFDKTHSYSFFDKFG